MNFIGGVLTWKIWRGIETPDASSPDGENLGNWAMLWRSFRGLGLEMLLR